MGQVKRGMGRREGEWGRGMGSGKKGRGMGRRNGEWGGGIREWGRGMGSGEWREAKRSEEWEMLRKGTRRDGERRGGG